MERVPSVNRDQGTSVINLFFLDLLTRTRKGVHQSVHREEESPSEATSRRRSVFTKV